MPAEYCWRFNVSTNLPEDNVGQELNSELELLARSLRARRSPLGVGPVGSRSTSATRSATHSALGVGVGLAARDVEKLKGLAAAGDDRRQWVETWRPGMHDSAAAPYEAFRLRSIRVIVSLIA
jgi:hypothetical protein